MATNELQDWYDSKTPTQTATEKPTGMITAVNNWQNTPDQTVSGQVQNIVKQDSPLMQMARTQADQESNRRGLVNSSIGIGAAQDSVYKTALPIAQTDAAQAARVAGYNVDTLNKANEYNATNEFNRQEREANNAYDFAKTQFTEGQANTRQTENVYAGLADTYAKSVASINADPNMTQQAKTYAIKELYDTQKANITMLSAVGKMENVSALLQPKAAAKAPRAGYRNYVPAPASSGGGKIICTRWYELGLMDQETYEADQEYGKWLLKHDKPFMQGYLRWAKHVVKRMGGETWQSRLFIKCIGPLVRPWSIEMSHRMGVHPTGSKFGGFLMWAVNRGFIALGRLSKLKLKATNRVNKFLDSKLFEGLIDD